ncbi:MAG: NAD kinase [Fimbriimonadaceae bacterium]|nr:NAD kinase [Fimbriimonadaceae bacterium]
MKHARVNLLVNVHRPDAIEAAVQTRDWLRKHQIESYSDREASPLIGIDPLPTDRLADADLLITFGGDGTLIRAAHICSSSGTPILGVYYGRFGFVTQCRPNEIGAALSQFFDGGARIEERMMVQADLVRGEVTVASLHCLNEAALQRAATTQMISIQVKVGDYHLTTYPADGVIVASPTGSTAYNLSAGGPIVDPTVHALLLTALTPHTLSARPLILHKDSVIELSLQTEGDAVLSCDGTSRLHLLARDRVRITSSPRVTRLVSIDEDDFIVKLSQRMFWNKGAIPDEVEDH